MPKFQNSASKLMLMKRAVRAITAEINRLEGEEDGCVYIAWREDGKTKIGMSRNPLTRLAQLTTGSGLKFNETSVFRTFNYRLAEKFLHSKYEEFRTLGEYFDDPEGELYADAVSYMSDRAVLVPDNPQVLEINDSGVDFEIRIPRAD